MSIQIGRHIQTVLRADATVSAALANCIYPIVIPQSTPRYPFLVYTLLSTTGEGTKDGNACDDAKVSMILVHKDYDQGITLANHIRYLFEGHSAAYGYMKVIDCLMYDYSEDWDDTLASYVFVLNFNFNTIDL